jgi:hypothetical protein
MQTGGHPHGNPLLIAIGTNGGRTGKFGVIFLLKVLFIDGIQLTIQHYISMDHSFQTHPFLRHSAPEALIFLRLLHFTHYHIVLEKPAIFNFKESSILLTNKNSNSNSFINQ